MTESWVGNQAPSEEQIIISNYEQMFTEKDEEIDQLKAHILTLETVIKDGLEYVRCGIGANYSGEYFEKKMDLTYKPIRDSLKKSPVQSLAEHNAALLEKYASELMEHSGNAAENGYPKFAEGVNKAAEYLDDEATSIRQKIEETAGETQK